jgi:hypothetical protein
MSGGIVSTTTLIPKYVEPQTKYTTRRAAQICLGDAVIEERTRDGVVP